jgi:hypothetical protein
MKSSAESLDPWIRKHLQNRKIELKGKVVWKTCPDSPPQIHAKCPSRSTVALLNDLMSAEESETTARFEKIFLPPAIKSPDVSGVFDILAKTLNESRFFPEFAGSLPVLSSSQKIMRALHTEGTGANFLAGFFANGTEIFAIVFKADASNSKQKKRISDLNYLVLTELASTEGSK